MQMACTAALLGTGRGSVLSSQIAIPTPVIRGSRFVLRFAFVSLADVAPLQVSKGALDSTRPSGGALAAGAGAAGAFAMASCSRSKRAEPFSAEPTLHRQGITLGLSGI